VIVHGSLQSWMSGSDPLYTFLPLALAALTTAIIFGVQRFVGLCSDHDEIPSKANPLQKEQNNETNL
jgi:hypothetical protein